MARTITLLFAGVVLSVTTAFAQPLVAFDASKLVKLGDEVKAGAYLVRKIGDGAYQINDPGDKSTKGGGWGVDMYLVRGTRKAMLLDLGNNYMAGYEKDAVRPRPNAAEELRAVVSGLIGRLPLEVAITHMHPDHDGMAGAFAGGKVPMWAGEGEDLNALKTQHNLDPSLFRTFKPGSTSFDLGGGHVVETFPVRGHSNGGTVYLLKKDSLVFSGDALGSGFGQAFGTVERLKQVAEDSQNLVNYIKANYAPYREVPAASLYRTLVAERLRWLPPSEQGVDRRRLSGLALHPGCFGVRERNTPGEMARRGKRDQVHGEHALYRRVGFRGGKSDHGIRHRYDYPAARSGLPGSRPGGAAGTTAKMRGTEIASSVAAAFAHCSHKRLPEKVRGAAASVARTGATLQSALDLRVWLGVRDDFRNWVMAA